MRADGHSLRFFLEPLRASTAADEDGHCNVHAVRARRSAAPSAGIGAFMSAIKNLLVWRDAKAFYTTGNGWVDAGLQPATTGQYLDWRGNFWPEKVADAGGRTSANADNSH